MKKNTFLLFLLSFSFAISCLAQTHGQARIDSLLAQLPKTKEDTDKILLLLKVSGLYDNINLDKATGYGQQALDMSEKINWLRGIANATMQLGLNYDTKGDYKKALEYDSISLEKFKEYGRREAPSGIFNDMGRIYARQSNYPKALDYFIKAFRMDSGSKTQMAVELMNIGCIYLFQANYPLALNYFLKALKINEDIGDKSTISTTLMNIGVLYYYQSNYSQSQDYYSKALKMCEDLGDRSGIGYCLMNIGTDYVSLSDYSQAQNYYEKALKMFDELGDKEAIGECQRWMGTNYMAQSEYPEALDNFSKSLSLSREIGDKDKTGIDLMYIGKIYFKIAEDSNKVLLNKLFKGNKRAALSTAKKYCDTAIIILKQINQLTFLKDAYLTSYETETALGDYKAALESYKNYTITKDSVFNAERSKTIDRLAMQYEFYKKHAIDSLQFASESTIQTINLKKQKTFTTLGFIGMALVALLLFFVYRNYSNQRKSNIELQVERSKAIGQKVRAERSEAFKQQFLANMSHEIRTPMNAISGMTDILIEKGPHPNQVNYLTAISKSSDVLLHIINDILDLSKIEAGKISLEAIDFSVSDILTQVKDTLNYKAEEKGLQLIINTVDNVTDIVVGDPYRLTQILMNLGGNAVKFTEKGSIELKVENEKLKDGKVLLKFSITDTGMGIPKDKIQTLFGDFTQVNSSDTRNYGGTGLGLSISKKLVELQGGNIWVQSTEGRGTTFSFNIIYPTGTAEKLKQRIMQEEKLDGSLLDELKILLVDDNEYNRLVAEESLLLKAKVHIDTAVNGEEAINMLKKNAYDVILMDIQMPGMNGYDASRYIRNEMKIETPIIALTASVLRSDLDKCFQSGMNAYLPKPFKVWQLITTIAEVTGRKTEASIIKEEKAEENILGTENNTVTDLTFLKKFCENDEARMRKYIKLYLDSIPGFKERINAGRNSKDMAEIALQVHSFKPKWMMMGMKGATELAVIIDRLCKENNNDAFKHVTLLIEQTDKSVMELKDKC